MEEKQVFFLVVIVVLNQFVHGDSLNGEGAIGCSRLINLCRYDEFCNAAEFYPFGKCKRRIFKKNFSHIKDQGQKFAENKGLPVRSIPSSAEDTFNNKYDMTYFKKDGSVKYPKNEKSFLLLKKNFKRPAFEISFIRKKRKRKRVFNAQAIKNGRMATNDNDKKYDMTFLSENFSPDLLKHDELSGNNINDKGTSRDEPGGDGKSVLLDTKDSDKVNRKFEKKHVDDGFASSLLSSKKENREVKFEKARNENIFHDQGLNEFEKSNQKEVRKSTNVSNNDESLDLEIEMKPLTENDKKYFDVDKSKLSLIPKTPSSDSGSPQKIEHVQVNSPSKKTKVGVLVAGKVGEIKADIIQNNSPDATYENVKDFFKSQQVSSIVDAPLAEQKDKAKMYDIQQKHDNENNIKRSTIPTPYVHPGLISLYVKERLNPESANNLLRALQDYLWGIDNEKTTITSITADDYKVVFHLLNNSSTDGSKFSKIVDRINNDQSLKDNIKKAVGMTVLSASLDSKDGDIVDRYDDKDDDHQFVMTLLIVAGCISALLLACVCIFIILKRTREKKSPKWVSKQDGQETASDYQSLWRHLRQATWDSPIQTTSVNHSDDGSIKETLHNKGIQPKYSWSEEPVDTKMDISTGHAILDYMEDHRQNENRLSDEWEELCAYVADPNACDVGKDAKNIKKNRYSDVLPYDHNRVKLRETSNATGSDYINASYIIDDDPRYPTYIAAQGPLASTVADFWQMIWERGVVVIVMLTKLADLGMPQCHRYWPQKGHQDYHIYQVNLISEHIWCDDYLVRSFYLKNIRTGETRTVTQFHFLSWPHLGLPNSTKSILDFRRKVLKCFRNQSSPVVVHCSGGIDRTGTYILIDMVLGKMTRGTKEIDLAATLEHLRDQRPQMVKTKDQFEFSLIAVADEVNAILQVLNKH